MNAISSRDKPVKRKCLDFLEVQIIKKQHVVKIYYSNTLTNYTFDQSLWYF